MPETETTVSKKLNITFGCTTDNSKGLLSINDPLESADGETVMVASEALMAKGVLTNSKGVVYDNLQGAELVSITKQKLF